jgi:prepilin-type N-terminal cleavage/methylation domain-containing protein
MRKTVSRSCRGFTLIELMIVVAIIGILSSIAIPEFQNMTMRARIAEREPIMRAIAKGVEDYALNSSFATLDAFAGAANPDPAGKSPTSRKDWRPRTEVGWRDLPLIVDGPTYCVYSFGVARTPTGDLLTVVGDCDIDGDGIPNTKVQTYKGYGNAFALEAESPNDPTVF